VDKTDLEIEAKENTIWSSGQKAASTEERVPCGAVSAPSGNSMQWL